MRHSFFILILLAEVAGEADGFLHYFYQLLCVEGDVNHRILELRKLGASIESINCLIVIETYLVHIRGQLRELPVVVHSRFIY